MDFKIGDKVKFKSGSLLGAGQQRLGQIGTVKRVHKLPVQGTRVDIEYDDGLLEEGISVHQIQHA